ncbi:MAG TPA: hypothetical protein VFW71_13435 [Actinomycetota bacterium]|nr:hypothetical protein [Actinomycetota bacterium]
METIHHAAVTGYWQHNGEPQEELEYRPFSGYGKKNGRFFPTCMLWRGNSIIPHHVAVETRETGIANGRIFYGPTPEEVLARRAKLARQAETPNAPVHRPFRWDARHAAVDNGAARVANPGIRLPDLSLYTSPVAKRPQYSAQPVSSHVSGLTAALADRKSTNGTGASSAHRGTPAYTH